MTNPPSPEVPETGPPQQPWHPPGGAPPPPPVPPGQQPPPAYPATAYPPTAYAYPPVPQEPPALPQEPVEYQHVLRGPRRAWWRPLASFGLVVAGVIALFMVVFIVMGIAYALMAGGDFDAIMAMAEDFNNPVTFTVQNLALAALIPVAMFATWIAHGVRPGFVSSVLGRFRWGWFGWSLLVSAPLLLVYIVFALFAGGPEDPGASGRPSTWVALLVMTLLTTPLQSAGEEYLFRGWLMQQIGAWVKNTYAALAIAIVLSSVVFALAHTSLDPWVLLNLAAFATATVLITWRTGGLESAVAMHALNNVFVLVMMTLTTGLDDAFITPDTTSDAGSTLISVASLAITTAALWWLAGKRGVERRTIGAATSDRAA